jgi:hypothetical protein
VAQTPYYDEQLLTLVAPKLPQLRRVIIAVTYVSLFFQLQGTDEEERQYYYFHEWRIPPPELRERLDIRMLSSVALQTPVVAVESLAAAVRRDARAGRHVAPQLDVAIDERGWSARPPGDPHDLDLDVIERKLAYHHSLMHWRDEPASLASLDRMLRLLRARGIDVVLITPPVWPLYCAGMQPQFWNRTQQDLQALTRKYQARYLSFLNAPELTADDFLDADHLNQRGAVVFTQLLSAAIERRDPEGPRGLAAASTCRAAPASQSAER